MSAFVSGGVYVGGAGEAVRRVCAGRAGTSASSRRVVVRMADDGFADLQPGDPGYKPKASETVKVSETGISPFSDDANYVSKVGGAEMVEKVAKAIKKGDTETAKKAVSEKVKSVKAKETPVVKRSVTTKKRGLALLADDLLRSGPERFGVGRQDVSVAAEPQPGEPNYVAPAYKTAFASTLGISSFEDDPNSVTKVGGIRAVQVAAERVAAGKSPEAEAEAAPAKEDDSFTLSPLVVKAMDVEVEETVELPSYLLPLPEDTPRKGRTWVNTIG